jgi:GAF domain-containing protein
MKLSIFHRGRPSAKTGDFLPDFVPGAPVADRIEADLSHLRTRILNGVLVLAGVVSAIVYLANLRAFVDLAREGQWGWLVLYSLVCLFLLLAALIRRIPYLVRAGGFLFILLIFGLLTIFASGVYGIGYIFLIAIPIFAGILLGATGRINALALSVAAMISVGLLMDSQVFKSAVSGVTPSLSGMVLPGLSSQPGAAFGHPWLAATGVIALFTIAVSLSFNLLVREMESSLREGQSTLQELEGRRLHLESQMQQNTRDLERRLVQIRTAAEITGTISRGGVTVPLQELLPQVCHLILDRFDLYYVGIFLIDKGGWRLTEEERSLRIGSKPREYARLVASAGEAGDRMLIEGYKLEVGGESMVGWCTANRQARIALDVGQEASLFYNPYLPEARSELALPIYSQEEALGALTIQSRKETAFDKDDVAVMQGIADNLASVVVNTRLFAETQASLEEIQTLHRQYLESAWVETLQNQGALQYTYYSPSKGARFGEGAASEAAGTALDQLERIQSAPGSGRLRTMELPIRLRDQVIGVLTLEAEPRSETGGGAESSKVTADWTQEEKAFIEAVMDQAALALENARLLDETRRRAEQERLTAGIAGKVWASGSVDKILRTALQELSASLGVSEGTIRLEVKE